jgi:hypothetical protein
MSVTERQLIVPESRERLPIASDPMLAMIERAARDPNVDIDKLERLFALHERSQDEARKSAYNSAMAIVQAKIKPVYRDAVNKQTGSPYATLEAISDAITPIYTAEGFSLSYDTADCPTAGYIRIVCDVMHSAGHTEKDKHFDLPLDDAGLKGNTNKTPIQASGSTISYGRRYLKCMIFDVTLTNEDNDGQQEPKQDEMRGDALNAVDPQEARNTADKMLSALGVVGNNPVDTDQKRAMRVMDLHDMVRGNNDLYIAASHLLPPKSRSAWKKYKAMAEELTAMEIESNPRQ